MWVWGEGGDSVGFRRRAGADGCDSVAGRPGWEAEMEGEGGGGGEGVVEAVAEGIIGVAGKIDVGSGW